MRPTKHWASWPPTRPHTVATIPGLDVVRRRGDNLATLYGAVDDGAVSIALPALVKKELKGASSTAASTAEALRGSGRPPQG
jgi:hypothetical protein